MVATWAICALSLVGRGASLTSARTVSTAASMPRLRSIGLWPASTRREALGVDRLGEHRRGGGAVAGLVARLRGDLAHHLGAHVLELAGELDLLGDRDAVLGDDGRAPALLDDDVAALGAERDLHGVGEGVDALEDRGARAAAVDDLLRAMAQPFGGVPARSRVQRLRAVASEAAHAPRTR